MMQKEGVSGISWIETEQTIEPKPVYEKPKTGLFKTAYGENWRQEAGRKGGKLILRKYGREFFVRISKIGPRKTPRDLPPKESLKAADIKDVRWCMWNVTHAPSDLPEIKLGERYMPTVCDPCKDYLLSHPNTKLRLS